MNLSLIYVSDQIAYYAEDINFMGKTIQTIGDTRTELEKHLDKGITVNLLKMKSRLLLFKNPVHTAL